MAAPSPPTPDEALALVSDPTASLCGNFVRTLLRLPVLFYNLIYWLIDESGESVRTHRAGDKIESFTPQTEDNHRKLCNGQALDREEYAELYAAIGNTYDTMDGQLAPGSLLFRVPKCGARFALANGSLPSGTAVANASVGGEERHTLLTAELPSGECAVKLGDFAPDTAIVDNVGSVVPGLLYTSTNDGTAAGEVTVALPGSDTPHNTLPPYYGVFVYICTGK